jgi:hypothetical protein
MATRKASSLGQEQEPLRDRYGSVAAETWISGRARTGDACGANPVQGAVVPASSSGAPPHVGFQLTVGADRDHPYPRDLLAAAPAARFDSTLPMRHQTTNQKGVPMRFLHTTTAFIVALLSLNVYAQQPDAPHRAVSTEPAFSVFVYEALGATPSVRMPEWLHSKSAQTPDKAKARAPVNAPIESAAPDDTAAQRAVKDASPQARLQ